MRQFSNKIPVRLLHEVEKKDWYRHGIYRCNLLFEAMLFLGIGRKFFKKEGIPRSFAYIQMGSEAYITRDDFQTISQMMHRKIQGEKSYLTHYIIAYRRDNERLLALGRRIERRDTASLRNEELAGLFEMFCRRTIELSHWLWSMEFLNHAVDQFVYEKIRQWHPEWPEQKIGEFLMEISYFAKRFAFQEEMIEVAKLKSDDLRNRSKLLSLYRKYAWLSLTTWDGIPFALGAYVRRIQKLVQNKEKLLKQTQENERKARRASRLIRKINDSTLRRLLKTLRELIYLKTERIDVYSFSWYKIWGLIQEIERRVGMRHRDFVKMTSEEILIRLRNGKVPPRAELVKREHFVLVWLNERLFHFYGRAYREIRTILTKRNYSHIKEVRGVIAYKGVVRGVARVLFTDRDLYKIKKGDIMITGMTNPNYNPAFDKVIAVVTDEGGILCHSAIMAREFGIPCIIGTKIATQVFKDGDLIEVDAEKGVVRLLKRGS